MSAFGAPVVSPSRVGPTEDAEAAYLRIEDEVLKLDPASVGRVTADVGYAASIALGAYKNLETLRPEFTKLGTQATEALDKLRDYALGALFAHLRSAPTHTQAEIQLLLEEARPLREKLLTIAEAVVPFGLFDGEIVASIRAGTGNIDTANDLIGLGALYRGNWSTVQNRVPVTMEMVDRAASLGPELLAAVGERTVGVATSGDIELGWTSLRARAFRLLARAYEELRRATVYVRWYQGDAAAFAPSLHSKGAGSRGSAAEDTDGEAESDAGGGNSADDGMAGDSDTQQAGGGAPAAQGASTGLPGNSPFAS